LLHILGGGISHLARPEFPAPLGVAMALRVMVHPTEANAEHSLEARCLGEDGEPVGSFEIGFTVQAAPGARPGDEIAAVFPVPLHQQALPAPGAYSFEILIDQIHQVSIPFRAQEVPQQ
jgi:hypothetical protein